MNIENVITMINAKLDCMKRDNGCDEMCNSRMCDQCSLNYEQGTVGEQKDCLKSAVKYLHSFDELQKDLNDSKKEIERLTELLDIRDDACIDLVEEIKDMQSVINDLHSELAGATNDYKQAQNEIKLLNKQIDKLIIENNELKFRNKMLTKVGLNSIYGITVTDNIKETTDNDNNY